MNQYEQLFSLLIQGKEQTLERLFPTLAQWHAPIFDTLTWGEMYPLLGQWLKQTTISTTLTSSEQFGKVWVGEWLFELVNGEELLVCCVIDPTTSHGMDVRMYHSFVPLFGKNQSREQIPLQGEAVSQPWPKLNLETNAYYLPATGRKNATQEHVIISQLWERLTTQGEMIHAFWQNEAMDCFEYSTETGVIGVVLLEKNSTGAVSAIRNYNDWE